MITNDKFDYKGKINDGCSLLFFARQYVDLKKTVHVPTFIDAPYSTKLNFIGKREKIKIDAIEYPVKQYISMESRLERYLWLVRKI